MGRLNSKKFQKSYRIFVSDETIKAPANRGFSALKGVIFYMPRRKRVLVQISGVKSPKNKGPTLMISETLDWPNGGDFVGMRRHLSARLKAASLKVKSRELPELDAYIEHCSGGGSLEHTSETKCPDCICPYCAVCPSA